MKKNFVKFAPYNNHTISTLLRKTVKFSTVYEFNDFNELHYISPPPDCITDNLRKIIKERISDRRYQCQLIKNIKNGNFEKNFVTELCEYIKNYSSQSEPPPKYFQCILETIAYSSVGIFCLSSIDVFKDDSAQLMFAHYAENLSGLALIYETVRPLTPTPINYAPVHEQNIANTKKPSCAGSADRVLDWIEGNYNDMDDFRNKSNKWEYESEHRLFNTPCIKHIDNITLKAILHTPRFNDSNKQTLLTINEKIYDNKVIIKEIVPSDVYYYFTISESNDSVHDWLSNLT